MLTTVNATKWMVLILTSIWIQIEVIRIKGHWILGGNVAFPFLVAILLWYIPNRIKEFTGLVKGEI
nr:MAG TPA: YvrJ protein family protein [Caudoviricetes sp.]